ncbi:hypothetical protein [uncultured Paludibaculum sp.]|uniref:hypothetical protein n=1 Tax=uncultured Paludibaculum sp. TaxID=1765020 RepID=UPI002AAB3888|nr:hypothetical protein [uncultured Paludibaculum sp.]
MSKSQHKEAKRRCPVCREVKTFPVRNDTCGNECARKLRTANADPADAVQEHRLKLENKELKARLNATLDGVVADERYQQFIADVTSRRIIIPEWIGKPAGREKHEVMPSVSFSDWHLDEVVKPEQVQYKNAYNRAIAEVRLKNFFQNTTDICFKYLGGFRYPGIVMPWLGDNFSGNIHEELRTTNADVLLSSLLYWIAPMASGLRHLADAFGKVYVPVVVGNHGRTTLKPIHKNRTRDNFDWLFAQMVAREVAGDKRITFAISESPDFLYRVYNTTYLMTHGDQAKGGSGIAAQLSPLMIMVARKMKREKFDYLVCGHWHRLASFMKVRCNGSGKGYDEYAFNSNFEFEPPQQDLWLTDPRHGVVGSVPVHVQSSQEAWVKTRDSSKSPVAFAA